ncbi:hypothetical protein ABMA28_012618 [Loxostege sticticalis]|uniref:Uncharacterized protein n=1 Tax=Loxostege sticticalis TaxID=481309 RepID=A0ABD0S4F9_LOXSC
MKLKRKEQLKNIQPKNKFTDEIKKPFADLTREERVDATMRTTFNMPEFSTDYIDFRDLRMRLEDDMRKSNKRKKLFLRSYSSSETDSGSYEMQKSSNYRKPKRFKVIDNGKRQKSDSDDKSSEKASKKRKPSKTKKTKSYWDSDNSDSSSGGEYKKPSSKEYYSEGNGGLSSDEVEEPVKPKKYKSNKKKEYYLQGGRIIADEDEDQDEDRRRRLPNFLPKRYHWAEDEIHNLGFFWFNGPQGRYSHVPVRP